VLGGGGLTGGVYEIGALRALDLLSVGHTVNEFDVFVGTSAGSFVAAAVANGVTPEEMMRAIVGDQPSSFPDVRAGSLLQPNYREFLSRGMRFPLRLAGVMRDLVRDLGQVSAVDFVLALAEALPTGLYSGEGLERYVSRILADAGRTDDFRELQRELYLVATDLDSCERAVFGAEGLDHIPISRAVSASSALPMIYKPVEIEGRDYVDGGLVSTTNLDRRVPASASSSTPSCRTSTTSRRSGAAAGAGSRTWAIRRSDTRRSSCSPISACMSSPDAGRTGIPASTSSSSSLTPPTSSCSARTS
jgi:NTE family protein